MKNYLLLLIPILGLSLATYAQDGDKKKEDDKKFISVEPDKEVATDSYNRWSVEVNFGQSRGVKPYADGYYSSNPDKLFGRFELNNFGIGARYMINPKFGVKVDFNYDKLTNDPSTDSPDFEMKQFRLGFQGVINAIRLFNIEEASGRFGLLLHGGIQIAAMTPKNVDPLRVYVIRESTEYNGGIVFGFTPQYRITKNLAIDADFSILNSFRQHYNWDGSYSNRDNNLAGQMIATTLGLSYSFGNQKIHGDWAIIQDKKDKEINDLNNRIGEIETLMNDSDKDGVPDYLDAENNSIAGVAVDTKGRMVDKNNNGVPDELEKYIDKTITTNNSTNSAAISNGMLEQLINDGYVAAYFDPNRSQPTSASSDNIGFILNYLKNNPEKSIEITGYADELGSTAYNNKLSAERAQNIKTILTKAGINPSRLTIVGNGIDSSVDKNSDYARRLVRKVVFKIK
ncbi:OmpA family protein [Flavobacterium sp.]|uniref:OmpA family protein n=1 Tax=Flavobacterium sp. TaxID=239 RepID=UPI002FDA7505